MREGQEAVRGQVETAEIAVAERRDVYRVRLRDLALHRGPVGSGHHADALDMIALQTQEPEGALEGGDERRVIDDHDETPAAGRAHQGRQEIASQAQPDKGLAEAPG